MSDDAEDRDGTVDAVTEQAGEQEVAAWSEPAAGPRWSEIASEAGSAVSAQAGQAGPDPAAPAHSAEPATEAGRARRPSSLRSGSPASTDSPRRRLTAPSFPSRSTAPDSPGAKQPEGAGASVSDSPATGRSGQMASAAGSLMERIPVGKLQALVKERPEAGLGLAFVGGLLIATILRRLAR